MKIHIIGAPGSGKSYLARRLSKENAVPHHDLDDLQWVNTGSYGVKRGAEERDAMLREILKEESWIIEGVYYAWCGQCFADADIIYLLNVPRHKYRSRIIRRFIKRKLHPGSGKKETLRSVKELLKWADHYQKENLTEIRKILAQYPDKVVEYNK